MIRFSILNYRFVI